MAVTDVPAYTVEDFEYTRHGSRGLTLRLFKPSGPGPFPCVVNLHGGAWCNGDLKGCEPRDIAVAEAGIASAAIDFRHADDGYPTSLVDILTAVRWVKEQANELGLDADRVGLAGQSSGGHLAMLAAMRPDEPGYQSSGAGSSIDSRVNCVAMTWPVINPISRYKYALRLRASAEPPAWVGDIPERHNRYWKTEASMIEGNPMLALERGEQVLTPPALWIQGEPDPVHDYRDPDSALDLNEPERFASSYRDAGGLIDVVYIGQENRPEECLEPLVRFLSDQLLRIR